ncbi:MAG: hypothetical protein QM783_19500 [Phycisphaerales bacterium]
MRTMTSGQVEREKRAAARTAQVWMYVSGGALLVLALFWHTMSDEIGIVLVLAALCTLPVAFVAQVRAAKLGRMAEFFSDGLCPYCAAPAVEAWRIAGRGVRCPECGLDQSDIEQTCKGCRYDLRGCPPLLCEPVMRMECGRCKCVYVREE